MRKLRTILLGTCAVLVCALAALPVWLLYTDAGAAWLWARTESALAGRLRAESVTGSLRGGLSLRGLRFTDESVDLRIERLSFVLDPDLFAPAINLDDLHAGEATVALRSKGEAADDAKALSPGDLLEALDLPVPLRIRNLRLERLAILAADESTLLALDSAALTATLADALRIERLDVESAGGRASLTAELGLDTSQRLRATLSVDASDSSLPLPGLLPRTADVSLEGTLANIGVTLAGRRPELHIAGSIRDVFDRPRFDLTATAPSLSLAGGGESALLAREVRLAASGHVDDYRANVTGLLESAVAAALETQAELGGDLGGLRVTRLALASPELDAELAGRLGWANGFDAAAELDLARLEPGRWLSFWPDGEALSGRGSLRFDGKRFDVDRLTLGYRETEVEGAGTVDIDEGVIDVKLGWTSMQWPLAPSEARLASPEATLELAGNASDWRLAGDVVLAATGLPSGRFSVEGRGSQQRADVAILDSQVLGGRIVGNVSVEREPGLHWSAQLETANLQVTPLVPALPGRISAKLEARGQAEPFELDVEIESAAGELRARPVSAAGTLRLRGESAAFDGLRLASGESTLTLDGRWPSAEGIGFTVDIETLSDFLPDSSGRVSGSGRLRAADPFPLLELTLAATELGWRDLSIESLELDNRPVAADAPYAMQLAVAELVAGTRRISTARATLDGSPSRHELRVELSSPAGSATVAAGGALTEPARPAQSGWDGRVSALELRSDDGTTLSLREPAALRLGRDELEFARGCLEDGDGGTLCVAGRWSSDTNYAASVELGSLPLDLLMAATGAELGFTQRLDGAVSLATGPAGRPSGTGRIDISEGVISNPFDERLSLRTRAGFAAFELESGRLLAAEVSLPFSDVAEIAGNFRVLDVARGTDSPISGQLSANVRNIGVAASIVPQVDEAAGRLDAEFSVDGTLGEPRFDGGLTLRDGLIAYDPLGFRLDDIQIESRILPGNRIELDSTFRAGEGRGRLRSSADYLQGLSGGFEVALTGKDLTLIDLDDLSVTVDPELDVGVRGDRVQLGGRIAVPRARLASVKFINTGVSESDDVVLVGETRGDESTEAVKTSLLEWYGSVLFELGDEVVIDVDVAEARLSGSATYEWQGPAMPQASGAFAVSGKFEAYGQLLEITEGIIRYPGVPANNPLLRIRAEREIFGNSQVRSAGVLVTGTALRPQLSVYTTPATNQNRALTLLATGSDFNFEQGVGAVDVGTYVAPNLYVGYGIGLFERENVISVRYDLGRGFGIKGTSGKRAGGVDISYTIQR